ncbi:transcriptional regulator [Staphylococcus epidermidis]|uniref:transcriptional regulator n=1 Tax=Staphylococcus epidermidis TaxID=1282 RepID=UPI00193ABF3A|nr:transcriptional regulator [Staphylococcus epidermidis]
MYKGTIEIKAKVDMKVKVPVEVNRVSDMYEKEEIYNKLYHDDKDKFLSEAEVVGVDIDETGWELN